MQGRLQWVGWNEVVVLQEIAAKLRRKEDDRTEDQQEASHAQDIVHRVVGMERNTVERMTVRIFRRIGAFDLNAVRVIRSDFMQSDDVGNDQTKQNQRHSNHVEAEEAVQSGIAHHVVTTDQQSQVRADKRNGRKQVHDHLRAPIGHLSPRQQVAHEGFSHQAQEDGATEDPHQLTGLAVRTVNQATEHVHVDHDEKR